jgi:hypothetical protein
MTTIAIFFSEKKGKNKVFPDFRPSFIPKRKRLLLGKGENISFFLEKKAFFEKKIKKTGFDF